jgi:hypothetical protein
LFFHLRIHLKANPQHAETPFDKALGNADTTTNLHFGNPDTPPYLALGQPVDVVQHDDVQLLGLATCCRRQTQASITSPSSSQQLSLLDELLTTSPLNPAAIGAQLTVLLSAAQPPQRSKTC